MSFFDFTNINLPTELISTALICCKYLKGTELF